MSQKFLTTHTNLRFMPSVIHISGKRRSSVDVDVGV